MINIKHILYATDFSSHSNQAYFHECLNLASVMTLPVVYVCENNLYGEWTRMETVTAGGEIAGRAAAYALPGLQVDGNDLLAVLDAASAAVACTQ